MTKSVSTVTYSSFKSSVVWRLRSPRKIYCERKPKRPSNPSTFVASRDRNIGEQNRADKEAIFEAIADHLADAVWADLAEDFDDFGVFPTRKTP